MEHIICGIYKLIFKDTNKIYIGKSKNIYKRFKAHIYNLKNDTSPEKLRLGYSIFGEPTIEVVHVCSQEELSNFEEYYIEKFNSVEHGFNTLNSSFEVPDNSGEKNGQSKYSNEKIIEVFNILVDSPELSQKEIAAILNVSEHVINGISSLSRHNWLETKFPDKYQKLKEYKNTRFNRYSKEKIIEVFNMLTDIPKKSHKEISDLLNVAVGTVNEISRSTSNLWLEKEFPEKYQILRNLKYSKSGSAKQQGIIYPLIKSPEGEVFVVENTRKFAEEHNIQQSNLHHVLTGKRRMHKGWVLA